MSKIEISSGTAHPLPDDLRKALGSSPKALVSWEDITPLARNEWICWTISVKTQETRDDHVKRTVEELIEGKRRPCCWIGCIHRKDKAMSASQKFILTKKAKKK
ncbi:MAG: YdeI/OmpD-associated family protein [Patescibacteria group bacterium]